MILKFMQLGKNLNTGENNEKDSLEKIKAKLEEESKELIDALEERNIAHILEESFDVVQVVIRIFALLKKNNVDLEQANRRHTKKILNRGWKSINTIKVTWDK